MFERTLADSCLDEAQHKGVDLVPGCNGLFLQP